MASRYFFCWKSAKPRSMASRDRWGAPAEAAAAAARALGMGRGAAAAAGAGAAVAAGAAGLSSKAENASSLSSRFLQAGQA